MRNLTQSFRRQHQLTLPGLLALLLVACAGVPPGGQEQLDTTTPNTAALEQMATDGRFLDAALAYSRLAADAPSPQRERYTLRTAELLMLGNYVPQALQMLNEIDATTLATDMRIRHALLSANISLARQLPDTALDSLNQAENLLATEDDISPQDAQRLHQLRATAFAQLGNHLESARERVLLEPLLDDPDAVLANQEAILATLQNLSPAALQILQTTGPPDVLSGWLELVQLGNRMADNQQSGADMVTWRERYPAHPALDDIIAAVMLARPRVLPLPKKIALILPLNNRFARAASAIRDGFLAAYYAQSDNTPANLPGPENTDNPANSFNMSAFDTPASVVPGIAIYDAGDDPAFIDLIYEQAVDDGAEFVVGPLNKDAVNQLATHDELPVPVLALNYSEQHGEGAAKNLPDNLFQLSLSPEQEAQQIAERAWLDGYSRAAIITPSSAWGTRVARAFSERWLQFGGHVVEKQTYNAKKSDYSLPIRRLLNVDESEQRHKALRRVLGKKTEFIPRRRQDIDFIFMAAGSRQARLIRPQLRFHHAPKVPVYATSHSYSGSINADMDRDMDGVTFADMPWTLHTEQSTHALKADIEAIWPNASKRYSRLFALGVDA
ncbi:MAG: ABC transporter substrate-binding protein, partial [Gammaproteobacteria bacterium]|nr:ABC transporter substrate-binding protein [Gammaproteobacteria bacterium]